MRRPTLAVVAQAAGVSLKTASRVLNGEPNVATATRERVQDAAASLGFRRNAVAADLARGGFSRLVGFITGDLANQFYSALASGIERELREHGLQLLTASSDEDPEREGSLTGELLERRVGALIVTPAGADHSALRGEIAAGLPVVVVDRPAAGMDVDTVVIDNRGGTRAATRHLLAHGHRRIAFVGDEPHLWTYQERSDEFLATMRDAGVSDAQRLVRSGAHSAAAARDLMVELLAVPDPPTAVLAANNRATVGTLQALRDAPGGAGGAGGAGGRNDIAVVGFDDFELADLLGITVVAYDAVEMGRRAAELAVARSADPDRTVELVVVPTRVVTRGSGERRPR
ncbi:LacI family transcriptional regulator [Promicromonospora sp. AC04]|uniref:LacI family DNA-binding transcriptional regulator n=1 Tax=Promicromonospora sp. AC04 TaxID=2135723 RepID=UPI000D381D63|nr:LacI family DNA-binding transcriptional regulator [Promicromonospora sp. AC04]PUB26305.1 LacI family transcriptional regulator [Promicromonospora sp. AC04]